MHKKKQTYKIFILVCFIYFLNIQIAYSEYSPLSELSYFEQILGIQSDNPALIPRIERIENILFGHPIQDSLVNRINNIKNNLEQKNEEIPVLNLAYNYSVGDYYDIGYASKLKWQKFPVTVNIDKVPNLYMGVVSEAINKWKAFFPLEISKNPNSDIDFNFVKKIPKDNAKLEPLGRAFITQDNNCHKCKIDILLKKKYVESELEETVLHELGHAIGLGHSPNNQDIMFPRTRARKSKINKWTITNIGYIPIIFPSGFQQATPGKTIITQRDINTVAKIYSETNNSCINPVNYSIYNKNSSPSCYNNQSPPIPPSPFSDNKFITPEISPHNQSNIDEYLGLAQDYNYKGNYNLAINNYKKVLEINPNHADANCNVGLCYNSLGKYNLALSYLRKSLSVNPYDASTLNNLGNTYAGLGLYSKAIESYQKALSINPNFDSVYSNLSTSYKAIGNYDLAIESCKKAININPNNANAYNNLGSAYVSKGLYNQATECLEKALSINPNLTIAKINLDNLNRHR